MNYKKIIKVCGLSFILTLIGSFFITSAVLNQIKLYQVDVESKGALLPYQNYNYMTTEETFYRINKNIDVIPSYFRTDFASIPQWLWFIEAPYKAEYVYASIWHDYHYSCPGKMNRKEIDDIFYNLLLNEQASPWSAIKMYIAVRLFGGSHFFQGEICDEIIVEEVAEDKEFYDKEVIDNE